MKPSVSKSPIKRPIKGALSSESPFIIVQRNRGNQNSSPATLEISICCEFDRIYKEMNSNDDSSGFEFSFRDYLSCATSSSGWCGYNLSRKRSDAHVMLKSYARPAYPSPWRARTERRHHQREKASGAAPRPMIVLIKRIFRLASSKIVTTLVS